MKIKISRQAIVTMGVVFSVFALLPWGKCCAAEKMIVYGTGSMGGTGYVSATAVAKVFNELSKERRILIRTTGGIVANVLLVKSGEVDISLLSRGAVMEALGVETDISKTDLLALHLGFPSHYQPIVHKNSQAKSIFDLKGKVIAVGDRGTSHYAINKAVFDVLGLKFEDFKCRYMSSNESLEAFKDGVVEAFLCTGSAPSHYLISARASRLGAKLLPLDEETIKKVSEKYPQFVPGVIMKESYDWLDKDVPTLSDWYFHVASKKLTEEDAYEFTKVKTEHQKEIVAASSLNIEGTIENFVKYKYVLPIHPGSMKYLIEKGYLK